ncbi:MAG: phosphatase PAP2 family protein [Acidobacteriota bacterium]|nr:phosphatase PAP2 family protein [Acidobacteriota bacterium]
MKAPFGVRLYFFEIFTIANFVVLLFALRHITSMPFWTLGAIAPAVAGGFLLQALIGMAIRLTFAARRGAARELLATYRSKDWMADTVRLAIFSGLWVHTYGWIKLTIPVLHPRLFDQELWNLGRALFFGYSPSMFIHTVFAAPRVLRVIDWTYANAFFVSLNIAGIFMASAPERRLRIAFMNSNSLLWLIGAWLYVALPSLGPAYRFPEVWLPLAPFLGRSQTYQRLLMSNYQAVLASLRGTPRPINILFGVAAFPSLHVAFQTLAFLWMRRLTKWGGAVFGIFAVFIYIGSIVTGWHYFIDGVAGAALAWACYAAAQRVPAIRA